MLLVGGGGDLNLRFPGPPTVALLTSPGVTSTIYSRVGSSHRGHLDQTRAGSRREGSSRAPLPIASAST